jgi:hypothetical protein
MALTAFQIQQKAEALQRYIDIYGIELLDKISQEKHKLNFEELPDKKLGNFKKRLDVSYIKDFILANERLPTDFEARSLAHEFSPGRLKMLEVQKSLLNDLKSGPVDVTSESLAKKYQVSVPVLKKEAGNLQRNIWRKRMAENPGTAKVYPLKWMVDEGNDFDNTLNNLYKGKVIKYERNKVRDLFYDAFGRKNLEGSNLKNPSYNPEKWKVMRANWNDYNKVRNVITQKYPNVVFELDHPLAKSTLTNFFNATPEQLTVVNPMTKQMNRGFKKVLDERYSNAIKNKDYSKVKSLNKIAKDLNINFGKVDKTFTKFDYGSKPFEKLDVRKSIADALTQQQDLSTRLPAYTKANPELFAKAGIDLNKLNTNVPELGIEPKDLKRLVKNLTNKEKLAYCSLLSRGGLPGDCAAAIDNNPVKAAQVFDEAPATSTAMTKVKNAASKFLSVAKKGGRFGAFAAVGATASAVKQFMSDDPTSYLSDENQQKNMLIDMVTEPVMEKTDPGITSDAQLPVLGAVTAAGAIPGGAEYYKDRRGIRPNDKFTGPMQKGVGKIRAAASPISGLLGKGLAATGTPLGMLALEPLYIGQQLAAGDSVGDIATNPINYLGAAFASPLTQQATKFASPAVSSIMRLGISPTMLKTVSRRFGLPGLALSAGISGYEMFNNYRKGRGLFDDG